jgi:hypothetical protein
VAGQRRKKKSFKNWKEKRWGETVSDLTPEEEARLQELRAEKQSFLSSDEEARLETLRAEKAASAPIPVPPASEAQREEAQNRNLFAAKMLEEQLPSFIDKEGKVQPGYQETMDEIGRLTSGQYRPPPFLPSRDKLETPSFTRRNTLGLASLAEALGQSPRDASDLSVSARDVITGVPRGLGAMGGIIATKSPYVAALLAGVGQATGGYLGDKLDDLANYIAGTKANTRGGAGITALKDFGQGVLTEAVPRVLAPILKGAAPTEAIGEQMSKALVPSQSSKAYTASGETEERIGAKVLRQLEDQPPSLQRDIGEALDPGGKVLEGAIGFSKGSYGKGKVIPGEVLDDLYRSGALKNAGTIDEVADVVADKLSSRAGRGTLNETMNKASEAITKMEPGGGSVFWGHDAPVETIEEAVESYPKGSIGRFIADKAIDFANVSEEQAAAKIKERAVQEINRVAESREVTDGNITFNDLVQIRKIFQSAARQKLKGGTAPTPFARFADSIRADMTRLENRAASTIEEGAGKLSGMFGETSTGAGSAKKYIDAKEEISTLADVEKDIAASRGRAATEVRRQESTGEPVIGSSSAMRFIANKLGLFRDRTRDDLVSQSYLGRYAKGLEQGEVPRPEFPVRASDFNGFLGATSQYVMGRMRDRAIDELKNTTVRSWAGIVSSNPWPNLVRVGIIAPEVAENWSTITDPDAIKEAFTGEAQTNSKLRAWAKQKKIPLSMDDAQLMRQEVAQDIQKGIPVSKAQDRLNSIMEWGY